MALSVNRVLHDTTFTEQKSSGRWCEMRYESASPILVSAQIFGMRKVLLIISCLRARRATITE
jgi:hypothetical protein